MPDHRPARTAATAAAVAALLTGCSLFGAESAPEPPGGAGGPGATATMEASLVEQFEQARENATTDFERDVLDRAIAAGEISAADYEEAFSRYRECVEDAGVEETYEMRPNGLYAITPPELDGQAEADEYMEVTGQCADGTTMRIEALYNTQVNNPGLVEDTRLLAVDCLIEEGLAPADYTVETLHADAEAAFEDAPFDPMAPEAQECLVKGGYNYAGEPS